MADLSSLAAGTEEMCRDSSTCTLFFVLTPVFYILGATFICSGNLLTVLAVWRTRELRRLQNFYVVSLAVADILVGFDIFCISFMSMRPLSYGAMSSKGFCVFIMVLWLSAASASNSSTVLIALDRYLYIVHPFKYEKWITGSRTKFAITASWCLSLGLGLGLLYFNRLDENVTCFFTGAVQPVYQFVTSTVAFLSVFAIVVMLYARIIIVAYQQQRRIADVDDVSGKTMWKYKMKNTRLFLTVCGLYFVLWLPYHIFFCMYMSDGVVNEIMTFPVLIGVLNSGINFIVYPCMNRDFRKAFTSILCCCKRSRNN